MYATTSHSIALRDRTGRPVRLTVDTGTRDHLLLAELTCASTGASLWNGSAPRHDRLPGIVRQATGVSAPDRFWQAVADALAAGPAQAHTDHGWH